MNKQQAENYLREYYTDNYVSASDCETFEQVLDNIGDTLDMLSEDMALAYNTYMTTL